jgi:uncharacterized protein (DUF924 family)
MTPEIVVKFWIDAGPKRWFAKDEAFDADLRALFEAAHHTAARGGFADWEETPEGALALLLLTDQIPRNIFRGSAHAFATDPRAREVAGRAIAKGFDQRFDAALRCFFYLPFEHSEDIADQARAVALFEALGDENYLKYAIVHRDIIARFGRFPHRNAVMGRATTPEEQAFLDAGGFAG